MVKRIMLVIALVLILPARLDLAQGQDVRSRDGLVVCVSAPACDAGAAVLARGGNAVDAAVATSFALAVTHPAAGNIGGGGFMIVRRPSGELASFDYREKAPLAATRTMYLDTDGRINRSLTAAGYLAPGVPGSVRGLELAHGKFGKLPWKDVVMPGVLLAEKGFVVSAALARSLNREVRGPMAAFPASVAAYGKPGGGDWAEGDRIVLTDLGRTLRAIAEGGADAFYKGPIAGLIADDMKANGGLITREDLAAYQSRERTPLEGSFRGYDIVSMAPPSSGGVALLQMLNILEQFDLRAKGPAAPESMHLQIEAMRRAYLDRARHLADPDFADVPVARLISKEYAKTLAAGIDPRRASSSVELGKDIVTTPPAEPEETTHFSVLDRDGMAVSCTTTLEGSYGAHVVVKGAGFILNNEMGDFNRKPGETNLTGDIGTPANLIAPGKRMLSSMTPTMVLREGRVVLLTGSPGGRTIINTVLGVVLGVTEFGLTGREAVDRARMHHQWLPDSTRIEQRGVSPGILEALKAMGHQVTAQEQQGDAHTIWIAPDGTPVGVNDRRSADSKASVPGRLTSDRPGR